MKKQDTTFSTESMAVLVVCHKTDYEGSFETTVACAKRFPLHQIFVLDYGECMSPNNFMQEWLEDIDLHNCLDARAILKFVTCPPDLSQNQANASNAQKGKILVM